MGTQKAQIHNQNTFVHKPNPCNLFAQNPNQNDAFAISPFSQKGINPNYFLTSKYFQNLYKVFNKLELHLNLINIYL